MLAKAEKVSTQRQTLLDQANAGAKPTLEDGSYSRHRNSHASQRLNWCAAQAAQAAERTLTEARKLAGRFDEFDKAATGTADVAERRARMGVQDRTIGPCADRPRRSSPTPRRSTNSDRQLAEEATRHRELTLQEEAAAKSQRSADDALDSERLRAPEIDGHHPRGCARGTGGEGYCTRRGAQGHGTAVADAKRAQSAKATADKAFKDAADVAEEACQRDPGSPRARCECRRTAEEPRPAEAATGSGRQLGQGSRRVSEGGQARR